MKRLVFWTIAASLLLGLAACNKGSEEASNNPATPSTTGSAPSGEKPLVLFAQANSQDPWRQVFDADTKAAAEKYSTEMAFEEQDAEDDPTKQISVIETFLVKKPKVLLVSPVTEAVQSATDKAFDAGIPVILLDRSVPGDKYTAYVGGDNKEIGKAAGEFMAKKLNGKGIVLMIQGIAGAPPPRTERLGSWRPSPNIRASPFLRATTAAISAPKRKATWKPSSRRSSRSTPSMRTTTKWP